MRKRSGSLRTGGALVDAVALVRLSARRMTGRWTLLLPLAPLAWTGFQALRLVLGWRETSFDAQSVPVFLVGMPLSVLAIALGVRVIAGEIEERTLEVAWTVPGGARKVWLGKLAAATLILLAAEALLALTTWLFLAPFPWWVLWTPFQAALFHLAAHAFFKALLFLAAGSVRVRHGYKLRVRQSSVDARVFFAEVTNADNGYSGLFHRCSTTRSGRKSSRYRPVRDWAFSLRKPMRNLSSGRSSFSSSSCLSACVTVNFER